MRVRTSHAPDGWRDEGAAAPTPKRGRNDPWLAHPVGDMLPLIAGTVLASYSNGHHGPQQKPDCGRLMAIKKERCALPAGHKDTHRTAAAMEARQARFDRKNRIAA